MQAMPGMEDYPIKLGTLLFTMVEPEKGHEVEYNRWYEHDHFYSGCMIGAVAVRGRPVRRHPAPEGPSLPGRDRHDPRPPHRVLPRRSTGCSTATTTSGTAGRSNRSTGCTRTGACSTSAPHPHAALRARVGAHRRDPTRLHHRARARPRVPGPGRRAPATSEEGTPTTRSTRGSSDTYLPEAMRATLGSRPRARAPRCSRCSTTVPPTSPRRRRGRTGSCSSTSSTTTPPRAGPTATPTIGEAIEASGLATHVWTGPFIQTDFGTDTYTDELW